METIHLKTVDPLSQELLKSAYQRGIKLSWDRYERLQPQDGFLRLGLSCPFGCMQGPCRIDPFGRGADRGACGLDRDRMAAALLLRICLSGALETAAEMSGHPATSPASPLGSILRRGAATLGGKDVTAQDLSSSACLLNRPAEAPEFLIVQALRLGILTVASLGEKKGEATRNIKVGYGLLGQGKGGLIGVCGNPSSAFLGAVREQVSKKFPAGVTFVSLGEWVPSDGGFLPAICTSGEAELALCSGKIQMVVAGPGADPALVDLCRTLNIPCASYLDGKSEITAVGQVGAQTSGTSSSFTPDPHLEFEAPVLLDSARLEEVFKKESPRKWVLLGGADHPQHPLGWIPSEVGSALQGENMGIAAWGDAALWMMKRGLAKSNRPIRVLDPRQGPVLAVKALAGRGKTGELSGVWFTGLKTCQDLSLALGLAALGFKVGVSNPLPLWGSEEVRNLLARRIGAQGGAFAHFDHPAQPQEILDGILKN